MTILWRGLMQNPLTGHQSGDGWTNLEAPFPDRQAVVQPDGRLRLEVRFGDKDPRYSDQRALLTAASQTTFHEGAEIWCSWSTEYPLDHVMMWPKQDELSNWPASFLGPGSCVEWHHSPSATGKYHGDWNLMPQQSAPIYTGVGKDGHYLSLTKSITESVPYRLITLPLTTGMRNDHVMHIRFSADPAKGLIEYWINGVSLGGAQHVFTLFPDCDTYLVAGIYRRLSIGDPSLLWPNDARPGISYPAAFVPKKGQRVYPKDDGYPAHMLLGTITIAALQADLPAEGSPPVANPPPTPPITPPAPPPSDFATAHPKAQAGLQALIAQRPVLDAALLDLDAAIVAMQQQRAAIQKLRDATVAVLDAGPWT